MKSSFHPAFSVVGGIGLELPQHSLGNTAILNLGGAKSGAVKSVVDETLFHIVDSWESMTPNQKRLIVQLFDNETKCPLS